MSRAPNPYLEDLIQADPDGWRLLFTELRAKQNAEVAIAQSLRAQEGALKWTPAPGRLADSSDVVLNHETHAERMSLRYERESGSYYRRRRHLLLSMLRGRRYRACEAKAGALPYLSDVVLQFDFGVPKGFLSALCARFEAWVKEPIPTVTLTMPASSVEQVAQ